MAESRWTPGRIERAAVLAFAGTSAALFALCVGGSKSGLWLLPFLPALRWRIRQTPVALGKIAEYALLGLLGACVLVGFIVTLYPVVPEPVTAAALRGIGWALVTISLVFAYGGPRFRPSRSYFPAGFGLLLAAALLSPGDLPGLRIARGLPVPATALLVSLIAGEQTLGSPGIRLGARLRRLATLILFLLGGVGAAIGMVRGLPWAQPLVEGVIANSFNTGSPTAHSGFSAQSRLGDIEELALSRRVVLRVWTEDPRYLRARVCTDFDGRTWHAPERLASRRPLAVSDGTLSDPVADWAADLPGTTFLTEGPESLQETGLIRTRVVQGVFASGILAAPADPVLLRAPVSSMSIDTYGLLLAPTVENVETYGVLSRRRGRPLGASDRDSPLIQACLALPPKLDPRLVALAAELGHTAVSDRERLTRTIAHLHERCRYSLRVGRFATADPVAEFLFDKKRGYCEYFASAAALLLRQMGVPTRYVTGFSVRAADRTAGHCLVRESHAHAWIEAYLPDQGWVEADPTPPADYDLIHGGTRAKWCESAWEWLSARVIALSATVRHFGVGGTLRWTGVQALRFARLAYRHRLGALSLLAIAGLVVAVTRFRRRRRSRSALSMATGDVVPELRQAMRALERLWIRSGVPRPTHRTPLEHARSLGDRPVLAGLLEASLLVVDAYYRVRFGGATLTHQEIAELNRAIREGGKSCAPSF